MDNLMNRIQQAIDMARKEPKSEKRDHILALLKSAMEYTEELYSTEQPEVAHG